MYENEQYIYSLLSKYITGRITGDEKLILKELLYLVDDDLLTFYLYQIWDEFDPGNQPDLKVLDRMFREIKRHTHPSFISLRMKKIFRVAGLLLIPLISLFSIYLLNRQIHHNYKVLNDRDIRVETLFGQQAAVELPDGTKVKLNIGSLLTYKQDYGLKKRSVDFTGEGYFEVARDKDRPFIVSTKELDIEVLGTSFNLYSYEENDFIELTLVSGSIKVITHTEPVRTVVLEPGHKIFYHKKQEYLDIRETDNRFETAWLRGDLAFRSAPLKEVADKLEKKYGMTISLYAPEIQEDLFTGTLSGETIFDAIRILQTHYNIRYEVFNDHIYILSREKE